MTKARTSGGTLEVAARFEVVELPLAVLHRADWNANRVPEPILDRIRRSLQQFGLVENLVARPLPDPCRYCGGAHHFEVISGNHRRDLYEAAGMETAPCIVRDLDDGRARLLAQALNRTRGADDPGAYAQLLADALAEVDAAEVVALLPETNESLAAILERLQPIGWEAALAGLPDQERAPFQQVTFTLHDSQAEQVAEALRLAKAAGPFAGSPNENSNGNALARIAEDYVTRHGA